MASSSTSCIAAIFLLSYLRQLSAEEQGMNSCPSSFNCNQLGTLGYPFTTIFRPNCGVYAINCSEPNSTLSLPDYGISFDVKKLGLNSFLLSDSYLEHMVNSKCEVLNRRFLCPISSSINCTILVNKYLWRCPYKFVNNNNNSDESLHLIMNCSDYGIYQPMNLFSKIRVSNNCSSIVYPKFLMVELSDQCSRCASESGRCQDLNDGKGFHCLKRKERRNLKLIGLGIAGGIIVLVILGLIFWHLRKMKYSLPALASRNISTDPTRTDLGRSKMYFSLPIFPYYELQEATNNFDPARELGDGGFGTVYYGKLNDRREVAVKRLHEKNYRQLEQFMNEVEILTGLRHQNLVSLYGCTSHRSRELLLVYEYVSNGTVADHLHGERAKFGTLTLPVRMSIAIETAQALSYLHASDIIHRDVKSNNILLDKNFSVKVADFGLSRLFPTDITHISTVPQGTPGYLDPAYHQCYRLTDKSDVYSFGVVLLELISSLPVVDVDRKEDDINLSSYALKRIQSGAFSELVDPHLGFGSNYKVTRMTTLVAELAFRCLQHKKEFRPSMDEVLEALISIENADYEVKKVDNQDENDEASKTRTEADDAWLLRRTENPSSPNSVIHKWSSTSIHSISETTSK